MTCHLQAPQHPPLGDPSEQVAQPIAESNGNRLQHTVWQSGSASASVTGPAGPGGPPGRRAGPAERPCPAHHPTSPAGPPLGPPACHKHTHTQAAGQAPTAPGSMMLNAPSSPLMKVDVACNVDGTNQVVHLMLMLFQHRLQCEGVSGKESREFGGGGRKGGQVEFKQEHA